jgi:uncharacterized protein YndB with AHSA1/START domain
MKTKNIQQSVIIKATPREVYEALMDSRKHSKFTGAKTSISRKVGGRCSVYGNYIQGINLDLVLNKRIVQAWRGNDWPKGHYCIVIVEQCVHWVAVSEEDNRHQIRH